MAQVLKRAAASLLTKQHDSRFVLQRKAPVRSLSAQSSSEHGEDLEESVKWRNITVVGYVVCSALTLYNFTGGAHEEKEERKEYSYLHIRNKEFPWGPDGLFEYNHEHEEE